MTPDEIRALIKEEIAPLNEEITDLNEKLTNQSKELKRLDGVEDELIELSFKYDDLEAAHNKLKAEHEELKAEVNAIIKALKIVGPIIKRLMDKECPELLQADWQAIRDSEELALFNTVTELASTYQGETPDLWQLLLATTPKKTLSAVFGKEQCNLYFSIMGYKPRKNKVNCYIYHQKEQIITNAAFEVIQDLLTQ